MDGSQPVSPYLTGNFAPVSDELDAELTITGEVPRGLRGVFYRNGPNPQFEPRGAYHWFSGDGMVHALRVENGRVTYRNRYVRTPKWSLEHAAGQALFGGFDPAAADASVAGKDSGVANTNIVWHGERLMALEEAHPPFELDPDTLAPRGYIGAYNGRVTAHPKVDPVTGEMLWFGYSAGERPFSNTVAYGATTTDGRVTCRDDFEAPFSSMVHDFMVTDRHVLFPILPLTGSLDRVMRGGPAYAWEPDRGAHVGVMARDGGIETMRWFTTDPVYVFHPMNAWEADGSILADVMEYPRAPLFPNADGSRTKGPAEARLVRWTLDLAGDSDSVRREPLDDLAGEFPRFDERRAGLAYRHGWFAANEGRAPLIHFDCLAHIDHATGQRRVWRGGDASPGEPVFVPRAPDADEGDGWIVALVYRALEDASDFVVFDALDIEAGPIASARLPRRVPFGFHGNWRPLPA